MEERKFQMHRDDTPIIVLISVYWKRQSSTGESGATESWTAEFDNVADDMHEHEEEEDYLEQVNDIERTMNIFAKSLQEMRWSKEYILQWKI